MRAIGGELELKKVTDNIYFTDSGRSSLRLFLRSGDNAKKKYLIPNYFCEVIEDVFKNEQVNYQFYNIDEKLQIDKTSIASKEYDVLYVINYFGAIADISDIDIDNKILLEDNVFLYNFNNHHNAKKWYAFNSFRKITNLSDGSMVKTNLEINKKLIFSTSAPYSELKQNAKNIKYEYVASGRYSENMYLDAFGKAEKTLDIQNNIYNISTTSMYQLMCYNSSNEIERNRYEVLLKKFNKVYVPIKPRFYSFFVLKLTNRDTFRKEMMQKNIFLPIHWPKSSQENSLYNKIISIPLFDNYTNDEFKYLIKNMEDIL